METNNENIPKVEFRTNKIDQCRHLERRLICCKVGHGRFVKDLAMIDPENGKFGFIPHADMLEFTSDPMTGAIFLRYFCIEMFKKRDITYCK